MKLICMAVIVFSISGAFIIHDSRITHSQAEFSCADPNAWIDSESVQLWLSAALANQVPYKNARRFVAFKNNR